MQQKKSILNRSLVAGAIIAVSGITANATGLFSFNNLGSGQQVRSRLLENNSDKSLELACGGKAKSDTASKKGTDGKCGEHKMDSTSKKGMDGKCGEGKCGGSKKKKKKN